MLVGSVTHLKKDDEQNRLVRRDVGENPVHLAGEADEGDVDNYPHQPHHFHCGLEGMTNNVFKGGHFLEVCVVFGGC